MKNKKFVFALMVLMSGTLLSNAQTSLEKKLRGNLAQSKKHRETMLLKAQEQQRQTQDEKRIEMDINVSNQNSSSNQNAELRQLPNPNNTQAPKRQPLATPIKKEDTN